MSYPDSRYYQICLCHSKSPCIRPQLLFHTLTVRIGEQESGSIVILLFYVVVMKVIH